MKDVGRIRRGGPVIILAGRLGAYRNDGLYTVKKVGQTSCGATETEVPNLRSDEPVARMPSAGITNLRPSIFWSKAF